MQHTDTGALDDLIAKAAPVLGGDAAWKRAYKEIANTPLSEIKGCLFEAVRSRAADIRAAEAETQRLIADVNLRFSSGNSVPVERAHITAKEWQVIRAALANCGGARP